MIKKRNPTIGVILTELGSGYSDAIWRSIVSESGSLGIRTLLLPARGIDAPYGNQYQHNVVIDFARHENVDALIICTSSVRNYLDPAAFERFRSRFRGIPAVHLNARVEGDCSIAIDCRPGLQSLVDHLVRVHGYRDFAVIAGPAPNIEAVERTLAIRSALAANGVRLDDSLVVEGDYTRWSGRKCMEDLLERRRGAIRAVICANDEMAQAAIEAVRSAGLSVPDDIAVTGFDDADTIAFSDVPLSTVRQPVQAMARSAAQAAAAIVSGRTPPPCTVFGTEAVIRYSCGCRPGIGAAHGEADGAAAEDGSSAADRAVAALSALRHRSSLGEDRFIAAVRALVSSLASGDGESFLATLGGAIEEERDEAGIDAAWRPSLDLLEFSPLRSSAGEAAKDALIARARLLAAETSGRRRSARLRESLSALSDEQDSLNLIAQARNEEEFVSLLRGEMRNLGPSFIVISLYPEAVVHAKGSEWTPPPESRVLLAIDAQGRDLPRRGREAPYPSSLALPPFLEADAGAVVLKPLFYIERQFGTVAFGVGRDVGMLYENLSLQLGMVYYGVLLTRALFSLNARLSDLSHHDELTGLLNRRGFMVMAAQAVAQAARQRVACVLYYADMDGLKDINDAEGHARGDEALKETSLILKRTFRKSDIVARMGGDEFCVLATDGKTGRADDALKRLDSALKARNARSRGSVPLSLSVGYEAFEAEGAVLLDVISAADAKAYEAKRRKKAAQAGPVPG